MHRGTLSISRDVNVIEFGGLLSLLIAFTLILLSGLALRQDYAPLRQNSALSPSASTGKLFTSYGSARAGEALEVYFIGDEAGQSVTLEITYPSGEKVLTQMGPTDESGVVKASFVVLGDESGAVTIRASLGGQHVATSGFHVWGE